jgi:hypothetical protein
MKKSHTTFIKYRNATNAHAATPAKGPTERYLIITSQVNKHTTISKHHRLLDS